MATRPWRPGKNPIFLAPRHNQPRRLLDEAPLQRSSPRKTKRDPHPTFHRPSPGRRHQQVPSHLWKRYHTAKPDHSDSSLIIIHKLAIPKGCARYPQVSIRGIWNSHVEPVCLTLAKLASTFLHTLGMRSTFTHHAHIMCTHHDKQDELMLLSLFCTPTR